MEKILAELKELQRQCQEEADAGNFSGNRAKWKNEGTIQGLEWAIEKIEALKVS
jgi:hypothetical protein